MYTCCFLEKKIKLYFLIIKLEVFQITVKTAKNLLIKKITFPLFQNKQEF